MEYFGSGKPYFAHRIRLKSITTEAYEWCCDYPDDGQPFRRFHVEWDLQSLGNDGHKGYEVVQFEWEEAAIMFKLRWGT